MLAPFAREPTTIEVRGELNERPYLELTVEMMREFGLEVDVARGLARVRRRAQPAAEARPTSCCRRTSARRCSASRRARCTPRR